MQAQQVARPAAEGHRQVRPVAEDRSSAPELRHARRIRQIGDEHADQAVRIECHVLPAEDAVGLAAAPLAERQQPAQPGVGRSVGRIDEERGAVLEIEPAADDQPHAGRLGRLVCADDAGEAVMVGDRQCLDAADRGLEEQLLAGTGAAQEREVRGALQLGVSHAKTPCRNQRCGPDAGSTPSAVRNSQKRCPASSSTWK